MCPPFREMVSNTCFWILVNSQSGFVRIDIMAVLVVLC